ncbi:hypothetical protein [Nonlabens ponticola]|nr:hypothetical protein [Nonlabens ponticola]
MDLIISENGYSDYKRRLLENDDHQEDDLLQQSINAVTSWL